MKCKKCRVELLKGESHKDSDGTVSTEYTCPKCHEKGVDMIIPFDALFQKGRK